MNCAGAEKRELMQKISECEFMVIDLGLFLDTHPDCRQALEEYHRHRHDYEMYVAEYERQFGPLILYRVDSDNCWTWVDLPWPWEMEAN